MNILICTDLHGSKRHFKKIAEKSKRASIIVCAGDISLFGRSLGKIISMFAKLKKPVLMIPGNHEQKSILRKECMKHDNVFYSEGKHFIFDDALFFLYSADGFNYYDKAFEKKAKKFLKELKKMQKKNKSLKFVFVSHAPPYNTGLDIAYGEHVGNISIRKFIAKSKPILSVHGHIHTCFRKKDKINNTKIINPGPEGMVIRI